MNEGAPKPPPPPGKVDDPIADADIAQWTTPLAEVEAQQKKEKDLKEWKEHFGVLAEVQEESEKLQKAAEEKKKADLQGWRDHFGPLAEIQEESEKLQNAAEKPKEEEHRVDASAIPRVEPVSPEGRKKDKEDVEAPFVPLYASSPETEQRLKNLERAVAEFGTKTTRNAEKLGVLDTIKKVGDWYNKRPMWQKLALGGGLMALGIPGASIPQKILSGVGMFATIEAVAHDRIKNQFLRGAVAGAGAVAYGLLASQLFSFVDSKLGFSNWISGWCSAPAVSTAVEPAPAPVPLAPEVAPPVVVEVEPAPAPVPETFDSTAVEPAPAPVPPTPEVVEAFTPATVGRGDTVWGLIENKLNGSSEFASLDRAQKDYVLDSYLKHLQSLGTSGVQEFGVRSGDINVIRIGETLNMEKIADRSLFDQYAQGARSLTEAMKENILRARG